MTVRANLNRLVGGAGEETILARVGEGIVSTIGSASSHKAVLENPDHISKTVLAKGLDAGTAFEILSIDIADVDVGKNIGAELQTDQAEADKRIAQAKAEERRALAVAMEQEFKAESQNQRAKVIAAEAQIPMAIADAFRSGRLGVMDYQRYRAFKPIPRCGSRSRGPTHRGRIADMFGTPEGVARADGISGFVVIAVIYAVMTVIGKIKGASQPPSGQPPEAEQRKPRPPQLRRPAGRRAGPTLLPAHQRCGVERRGIRSWRPESWKNCFGS